MANETTVTETEVTAPAPTEGVAPLEIKEVKGKTPVNPKAAKTKAKADEAAGGIKRETY